MSVSALIRCASRARATPFARPATRALFVQQPVQRAAFSVSAGRFAGDVDAHDPHHEESFEEFTARYAVPASYCFGERRESVEDAMA
jgi:cytochrome c oxidase subunit 5a